MKSINLGRYYKESKIKPVDAWMIYNEGKNKNWLMKSGIKFYSENPKIFSYFQGFNFKELNEIDESKISKYLNHIKEVIANENDEFYEYLLNWFSFILQNPGKKTGAAIVLTGVEGAGKKAFTDVLCNLLKKYSNKNISNIDNIVNCLQ